MKIPNDLKIEILKPTLPIPYKLLELADPSRKQIDSYLKESVCYIALLFGETVGVLVLKTIDQITLEVTNLAIAENQQGKGYGKHLLRFAQNTCKAQDYKKLRIATGNSSINQLALYQKMGFELSHIVLHFFTENYAEPIFENGIQCKHKVVLDWIC